MTGWTQQRRSPMGALALTLLLIAIGVPWSAVPVIAQSAPSPAPSPVAVDFGLPSAVELAADAALTINDTPAVPTSPDPNPALEAIVGKLEQMPPERWDVAALAATFEGDPERAFAFLRDSIGLDPYRGVLRGATGTLAARAGSAADRSLLLAALLDAMGVTNRLAFAELDQASAERVLARSFEPPVAPIGGLTAAEAVDTSMAEAVAARARRDHALLLGALGGTADEIGTAPERSVLEDVAHHVWVQIERDGQWVDLDPSLPEGQPGSPLVAASTTADAIPPEERASVTLRVLAENLIDGVVEERVALEQTLDAAESAQARILLYFRPEGGGPGLVGSVGLPTAYEPVLWADGLSHVGTAIPVLPSDDGFFGSGSEVRLTRVALELVSVSPGREPVTSERILLDRVAPELRATGIWTGDDLGRMPVVEDVPAIMTGVHHMMVSNGGSDPLGTLRTSVAAIGVSAEDLAGDVLPDDVDIGTVYLPMTSADAQLVLLSEHAIVAGLDASADTRSFIGRPRVFLVSLALDPDDPARVEIMTDLAVDGIEVVGTAGNDSDLAHRQRIWYGTAQTALETEHILRAAGAFDQGGRSLTGVSLAMGEPLTVISDASQATGASATMLAALAQGDIAVVPRDVTSASTWWTISGSDGATRSILDPGARAFESAGFPLHWGKSWEPISQQWVSWYDKTVVKKRQCGGGQESQLVTDCVSLVAARGAKFVGQQQVTFLKEVARALMKGR